MNSMQEVKELIVQVREQRDIREQMNEVVREKKSARQEANKKVKEAKTKLDANREPSSDNQRGRKGGISNRSFTQREN